MLTLARPWPATAANTAFRRPPHRWILLPVFYSRWTPLTFKYQHFFSMLRNHQRHQRHHQKAASPTSLTLTNVVGMAQALVYDINDDPFSPTPLSATRQPPSSPLLLHLTAPVSSHISIKQSSSSNVVEPSSFNDHRFQDHQLRQWAVKL
jgi:hypothetical protein